MIAGIAILLLIIAGLITRAGNNKNDENGRGTNF
jgi:hypothetical protein